MGQGMRVDENGSAGPNCETDDGAVLEFELG